MEYRWIENIEEFKDISAEWDKTIAKSGAYSPFLSSNFIVTWWKYFGVNGKLRIFVVYKDGCISGGLPLYLKKGKGVYSILNTLSYVGDSAANYTEPLYITNESRVLPVLVYALRKRNDWDILELTDIRKENKLISEYDTLAYEKEIRKYLLQDHMNMGVDLSNGHIDYIKTVSKNLKRRLAARRKNMEEKAGKLYLKRIFSKDEIERFLNMYIDFSINSFGKRERRSNFLDSKYTSFFKEFLILLNDEKRLDAHVLSAGEEILAISFGYKCDDCFNWVLTGFNYEHKYYEPGYLLIEELIKEICNRGETYYNWYGHERFYKNQWCNDRKPLYKFILVRNTIKGRYYNVLRAIENKMRVNKMVVSLIRKMKKT